jgi:peroxiredoxin
MPFLRRAGALALAGALFLGATSTPTASAEGASLNGLMAPELTFPAGVNGVERGATLSSFRGRVVWLKFWLRDCPRCRKTLPEAQRLHELYGKSGLVVLTVVHQYGPDQVKPFLDQFGYTFPVASDPTGALAQAYQVNHRPTDYLIGVDGRVIVSNGVDVELIKGGLPEYRRKELGSVPAGAEASRDAALAGEYGDYGRALTLAHAAASAPSATAEVKAFAARLEVLAKRKLEERIEVANVLWRRKDLDGAKHTFEGLVAAYAETPLAARAKEARDAYVAASSKGT